MSKSKVVKKRTSWVLCGDLDGWDGSGWVAGRSKRKGTYAQVMLIPSVIQKTTQRGKAIILQLGKKLQ